MTLIFLIYHTLDKENINYFYITLLVILIDVILTIRLIITLKDRQRPKACGQNPQINQLNQQSEELSNQIKELLGIPGDALILMFYFICTN